MNWTFYIKVRVNLGVIPFMVYVASVTQFFYRHNRANYKSCNNEGSFDCSRMFSQNILFAFNCHDENFIFYQVFEMSAYFML